MELTGICVIVLGAAFALTRLVGGLAKGLRNEGLYHDFRADLGRGILLGLEFLVAADIINTVAVAPSLYSVAVLAGIILIRTFLSLALQLEIEGRWPWQRHHRPAIEPGGSTAKRS
jgi:uncharacterized membrane protein